MAATWEVVVLLLVFLLLPSPRASHAQKEKAFKAFADTFSKSHIPQVIRSSHLPYPHSETYQSFESTEGRPCASRYEEKYRRADGVCNNFNSPFQGAALDTQRRLFSNSYQDKRGFPKIFGKDSRPLPSAREVSLKCFDSEEDTDGNGLNRKATQMVWQFGQFLAHDVTHLEKVEGSTSCCDGFSRDDPFAHLYNPDERLCFPIEIPADDPRFDLPCMTFGRSYGIYLAGVREPINAVTSYIDGSTIYGTSYAHQAALRLGVQGLLKTFKDEGIDQLPRFGNFPCITSAHVEKCPVGGDIRVSDQPGLAALHSIFHLEHNRIARHLFKLNPYWDDEKLFQEARKILIGIIQKIVYEDYLPVLLGPDVMEVFNLNGDYHYEPTLDAGAILDFTTSGLRYGHTLINTHVGGFTLSDIFLEPVSQTSLPFQNFPFYQSNHTCHEFNNRFTDQLRQHLFEGARVEGFDASPGPSFDLMALNVQRGREHGIAPYTAVRDACLQLLHGLPGMHNETPTCHNSGIYRDQEDIELFVGGVSEKPLPNAILGQTFACMFGEQFNRLKYGDRFFYQGSDVEGFNQGQREFVGRNTLASLICELNPYAYLQRDVFRPASSSNARVSCKTILKERSLADGLASHWQDKTRDDNSLRQLLFL